MVQFQTILRGPDENRAIIQLDELGGDNVLSECGCEDEN